MMQTVPATPDLVPGLLARIEPDRVAKLHAHMSGDAAAELRGCLARSVVARAGVDAEGVVNLYGIEPMPLPGAGYVWQVITPAIRQHMRAYLRQQQDALALGFVRFTRLFTYVEADNVLALRHIRRLGGMVGQVVQVGATPMHLCERVP